MNIIKLSAHASNTDPTAELVSSTREPFSVFKVRGGFVASYEGATFDGLFATKDAAETAAKSLTEQ